MKCVLFSCLLFTCCLSPSRNVDINKHVQLRIDSLQLCVLKGFIGLPLDSLPYIEGGGRVEKTVEGDEGESWVSVNYYQNNDLAFSVESNWEQIDKAYRVTVFSKIIKYDDISVGQTVASIREKLDEKIPSNPDGYLFVNPKCEPRIYLQLSIAGFNEDDSLYYGISNLNDIPGDLRIESIVIR